MASNKRVAAPAAFAVALLLLAYCAEAYVCTMRNGFYHGRCVSNKNCAHACIQDGIGTGGYCSKRRRRATGAAADIKWLFRRPVSSGGATSMESHGGRHTWLRPNPLLSSRFFP